jgi:hypothetical protein
MARRRQSKNTRGKHKGLNRYNPNQPDYLAVHSPLPRFPIPTLDLSPLGALLAAMAETVIERCRRRKAS